MQFNSYVYVLAFLPITFLLYFFINKFNYIFAKSFLVFASMFFFAYASLDGFKWLLISISLNYIGVLCLRKWNKKTILYFGILINIILLFYFKYTNFSIRTINDLFHTNILTKNLILPIGISFFTFQQISYLVDTFREETKTNTILDYLLYVTFFPKILMGPITKSSFLINQFNDESKRKPFQNNIIIGIQMFTLGFFKKVIIADTFANAVNFGFDSHNITLLTSMDIFLIMLAYTFQIYFDFSGYSDMAIASAKMLNIELPINFDSPYKAYSIRDFWKRWHISLTKFLTEYLYIPLGGNKKGKIRTYLNTMIVFIVSGFWHGANFTFILWGILHGFFSIFDRLTEKYRKNVHLGLQWLSTFIVVNFLWLLFRANSIREWKTLIANMITFSNTSVSEGLINSFDLPEVNSSIKGLYLVLYFVLALVLCLGFENTSKRKYKITLVSAIIFSILFVYSLTNIGSEAIFVYFNF